jgi:hypothetical protein
MAEQHLELMFSRADKTDFSEGLLAYMRYHTLMRSISDIYEVALDRVVAAFCATSPNNDYRGNLRSVVSILQGYKQGLAFDDVQISTYRHCGERAWSYVAGTDDFLRSVKGLKIRNFYHNVLYPEDHRWVTIDGHMVGAYRASNATMKELIVKPHEYADIAHACKALAFRHFLLPNQYQAIVWFVRKRVLNVVYDAQLQLFAPRDDVWNTLRDVRTITPFPRRNKT